MTKIIIFDLSTCANSSEYLCSGRKSLGDSRRITRLSWLSAEIVSSANQRYFRPDTLQTNFCETTNDERDVVRAFDAMLLEQAINEGPPRLVGFNTRDRSMPTLIARARAKAIPLLAGDSEVDMRSISYLARLNASEHCDLYRLAPIFSEIEVLSLEALCRSLGIPLLDQIHLAREVGTNDREVTRLYHQFRVLSIWLVFLNWSLAVGELTACDYAASVRATIESLEGAAVRRPEFEAWTSSLRGEPHPAFLEATKPFPHLRTV